MAVHQGTFIFFFLLAISLSKSNPITVTAETEEPKEEDYRLPNNVVIENYAIDLILSDAFSTEKSFKGTVKITFRPKEAITGDITLNAKSITLDETLVPNLHLATDNINLLDSTKTDISEPLERITFKLQEGKTLENTKDYILDITYTGVLHEDMYGFYLSTYQENGQTNVIATTQFQPTHARRAFPCFDEPNFKAKFDISITHPIKYRALSNTKGETAVTSDGKAKKTTFAQTPKMSTYLVAFIVSQFAEMNVEIDSISNAVWSQQQLVDTAKYSLEIAPKILTAMEEFTKIPYTVSELTKLDQVAIPDFSAGAMENWGLVTYRESALLWDKVESTAKSKERVATVVAHELAHMWFGNLITTDWWSSTWLNEGFARFFQYYACDKVEEDWELKHQFVIEQQQSIFNSDALSTAVPLTSEKEKVLTPTQISDKFSSITYNKGGSVIRMMEHFMGTEAFFKGIVEYTKVSSHHFANVVPQDVWNAMKTQTIPLPTGVTLENVMEPWTEKPGFPVVTVTTADNKIVFKAERFFFNKPEEESSESVWYIPITYTTSKDPNFETTQPTSENWLKPNAELQIPLELTDDLWIIVNLQSSAYIRVNYEEKLWKALQEALQSNHDDIHVLNRAQIADDSLNLARAGMITYDTALDVLQYLEKEINYYPWYSAFNAFAYLRRRINMEDDLGKYLNTHISNLMQSLYSNVSFTDKPKKQVDIHKKVLTLSWACQLGNEECIERSQDSFALLKENETPVTPDLRSVVYCTAIRNSEGRENWDFLWERFTQTNMATEAGIIISALGCTKDTTILNEYLIKSITENSGIRKQDAEAVFSAVISGNPEGVQVGLDFVVEKYNEIDENYGSLNALSDVITSLADRLTTDEQVDQFKKFVESTDLGSAEDSAKNALERCEENMNWVKSFSESLLVYLKEKVDGSTDPTDTPPGGGGAASVTLSSTVFLLSIIAILTKW